MNKPYLILLLTFAILPTYCDSNTNIQEGPHSLIGRIMRLLPQRLQSLIGNDPETNTPTTSPNVQKNTPTPSRMNPESCLPGQSFDLQAKECKNCGVGTYEVNKLYCKQCPPGTMNALEGSSSPNACLPCQLGFVAPDYASQRCTSCAGGYYTDDKTTCKPCQPGTFSTGIQESCQNCEAGSISKSAAFQCTKCPIGTFEVDRIVCSPCASGTFAKEGEGCIPCKAGRVRNNPFLTYCVKCEIGHYEEDRKRCAVCPEGTTAVEGSSGVGSCQSSEEVEKKLVQGEDDNSFDNLIVGSNDTTSFYFTVYYRNSSEIEGLEEILKDKEKAALICTQGFDLYRKTPAFQNFKIVGEYSQNDNIVKSVIVFNNYLLYTFQRLYIQENAQKTYILDLRVAYRFNNQEISLSQLSSMPGETSQIEECSICQNEYEDGDKVVRLGCNEK